MLCSSSLQRVWQVEIVASERLIEKELQPKEERRSEGLKKIFKPNLAKNLKRKDLKRYALGQVKGRGSRRGCSRGGWARSGEALVGQPHHGQNHRQKAARRQVCCWDPTSPALLHMRGAKSPSQRVLHEMWH